MPNIALSIHTSTALSALRCLQNDEVAQSRLKKVALQIIARQAVYCDRGFLLW